MLDRIASAQGLPRARLMGLMSVTTLGVALALGSVAMAQTPPAAAPKAPAKAAPKAPAAAPKAAAPAPQQPQAAQAAPEMPQFIYSPWTKFCLKGQDANAKQVCFTGRDGRVETGMPVVAAVIIEPDGEPKKILRVTVPLGMSLVPGTRVIVDQGQPMSSPYVICFANGCMADYEANADLVARMKKGSMLYVQAINQANVGMSFPVPLGEFGTAYDGPPTDPKVFEEQQKKLQDELQKRAEEARKKLEAQPGAPK